MALWFAWSYVLTGLSLPAALPVRLICSGRPPRGHTHLSAPHSIISVVPASRRR